MLFRSPCVLCGEESRGVGVSWDFPCPEPHLGFATGIWLTQFFRGSLPPAELSPLPSAPLFPHSSAHSLTRHRHGLGLPPAPLPFPQHFSSNLQPSALPVPTKGPLFPALCQCNEFLSHTLFPKAVATLVLWACTPADSRASVVAVGHGAEQCWPRDMPCAAQTCNFVSRTRTETCGIQQCGCSSQRLLPGHMWRCWRAMVSPWAGVGWQQGWGPCCGAPVLQGLSS